MDVKIGLSDTKVTVSIPKESKFTEAFMTDSFKPKEYWGIETVQDSPQAEPLIRIYRTKPPAGKTRAHGMVQGFYETSQARFKLDIQRGQVPGIAAFEPFTATEARFVRKDDNSFYFKLPAKRKPPVSRKTSEKTAVQTMKEIVTAPSSRSPEPTPAAEPAPVAEKKTINIRAAIDIVNKYVDSHGLKLSITGNGKLRGIIEYGDAED